MSFEFVNMFPYNAGIIVANLPVMRHNYPAFIAMMLDNEDGLYYPNYGPADQGIINKVGLGPRGRVEWRCILESVRFACTYMVSLTAARPTRA